MRKLSIKLVSKLVSKFVSKLASKLTSKVVSKLVNELVSKLANELVSKLANELASKLVNELVSKLAIELVSKLANELVSKLVSKLVRELVSTLVSKLVHCGTHLACSRCRFPPAGVLGITAICLERWPGFVLALGLRRNGRRDGLGRPEECEDLVCCLEEGRGEEGGFPGEGRWRGRQEGQGRSGLRVRGLQEEALDLDECLGRHVEHLRGPRQHPDPHQPGLQGLHSTP